MSATLPTGREGSCAIWNGTYAYIFGGYDGSNTLDEIVQYDPNTDSASVVAKLPTGITGCSAAYNASTGKAYILGGADWTGSWIYLDKIVEFLPPNTVNELMVTLPSPRSNTSSIWDGSSIYTFGGYDGVNYLDEIVKNGAVSMSAILPTGRSGMSAIWNGSFAYIFSGYENGGTITPQILRYDTDNDIIDIMSATAARNKSAAVWDGNRGKAYMFGGHDGIGLPNQILSYDPPLDTITPASLTLPSGRLAPSAIWDGTCSYVFGGGVGAIKLNEIVRYCPNTAPALDWTGEVGYEFDGLDPETGTTATIFTYRIIYMDDDNDPPAMGYPLVHIERPCGIPIVGSPFLMTLDSWLGSANDYTAGAIFTFSTMLAPISNDYSYYFNATDGMEWATGIPTIPCLDGPSPPPVPDNPTLNWTGEANYISDGLDPEVGTLSTTFTYRINYTDPNNDPPFSGYPKVHIEQPPGTEIVGSPASMSEVDPLDIDYTDGKLYTYSRTLPSIAVDYCYFFNATDGLNWATGTPTLPCIDGPDVNPPVNPPVLGWSGEPNYESDGIDPESGGNTTLFAYRINYSHADNIPPAPGYPNVYIQQPFGANILGSPFVMSEVDPTDINYTDGKLYTYSTTLSIIAVDYWYFFNASDGFNIAVGDPTVPVDAPDVFADNNPPSLNWTGESNYISDGLDPETGSISATFTYRINYTDLDNDPPLLGYPKIHIQQPPGSDIIGSPASMSDVDPLDTDYSDGKLYTYSTTLTAATDYCYFFNATDGIDWAIGLPTIPCKDAPDVYAPNHPPSLDWTDEPNYEDDGVNPDSGNTSVNYEFRVEYIDEDNQTGAVKLVIEKDGTEILNITIEEINPDDTNCTDGKLYTKTLQFSNGSYLYHFYAEDTEGAFAITARKTLVVSKAVGTIRGTVLDEYDEPLENVKVELVKEGKILGTVFTDTMGIFEFNNMEYGDYVVNIAQSGYQGQTRIVNLDESLYEIEVQLVEIEEQPESIWPTLLIILIILIVVLFSILVLIMMKKKKKEGEITNIEEDSNKSE